MGLSRKPERASTLNEDEVQKLILRGGLEPQATQGTAVVPSPPTADNLPVVIERKVRFYDATLPGRLERAVKSRPARVSVNTWILEAIHEKLEREEAKQGA